MHGNLPGDRAFHSDMTGSALKLQPKVWLTWARQEIAPIALFLALAALLLGFIEITDEVTEGEGEVRWFDEGLLLALRTGDPADPIGPRWFELAVADITSLGGFAVLALITLIAVGYLGVLRKWTEAATLLVATIGGTAISEGLKMEIGRARPDLVAHVVETTSMSFPSGHAMLSAVTYLSIGALLAHTQAKKRLRGYILGAAILVTLLIGASRVYLGVHWPTDVLAGWCLGAAWALVCWAAAAWLTRHDRRKLDA